MKKPIRPKRRYKSIKSVYITNILWKSESFQLKAIASMDEQMWICTTCCGSGKVKDKSYSCPVEGIKYNDIIMCDTCNGTGHVHKSFYSNLYHEYQRIYKKEIERYEADLAMYNSIVSKLTKEELKWMNIE